MATVNEAIKTLEGYRDAGKGESILCMTDRGNDMIMGIMDGFGSDGWVDEDWMFFSDDEDDLKDMNIEGTLEENGFMPAIYWYS